MLLGNPQRMVDLILARIFFATCVYISSLIFNFVLADINTNDESVLPGCLKDRSQLYNINFCVVQEEKHIYLKDESTVKSCMKIKFFK